MQSVPGCAGLPQGCSGQGLGTSVLLGMFSPTRAEMGCVGVPIPPSTPSSRSLGQVDGDGQTVGQQAQNGFSQAQQANLGQANRQEGSGTCFGVGTQMPSAPMFVPQMSGTLPMVREGFNLD